MGIVIRGKNGKKVPDMGKGDTTKGEGWMHT